MVRSRDRRSVRRRDGRNLNLCKNSNYYMINLFFVYFIGIVVGIALDNLFWIGYVKHKEMTREQEEERRN